jgi:hypothetical protein
MGFSLVVASPLSEAAFDSGGYNVEQEESSQDLMGVNIHETQEN